jgi:hypothetical protein
MHTCLLPPFFYFLPELTVLIQLEFHTISLKIQFIPSDKTCERLFKRVRHRATLLQYILIANLTDGFVQ